MAKSTTKKALIREAVSIYWEVRNNTTEKRPSRELCDAFKAHGWSINSDGAEKYVAIKGCVVAKWDRPFNRYTKNPIKEIRRFYRKMNREGLGHLCPRVYVSRSDFIVEQRCPVVDLAAWSRQMEKTKNNIAYSLEMWAYDIHSENVGWLNGRLKIFDALIEGREKP